MSEEEKEDRMTRWVVGDMKIEIPASQITSWSTQCECGNWYKDAQAWRCEECEAAAKGEEDGHSKDV